MALSDPRAAEAGRFSSKGFKPRIKDAFNPRASTCCTGVSALSSSNEPGSSNEPRSSSNAPSDHSSSHGQQLRSRLAPPLSPIDRVALGRRCVAEVVVTKVEVRLVRTSANFFCSDTNKYLPNN